MVGSLGGKRLACALLAVATMSAGEARALLPPTREAAFGLIDRKGAVVVPPACDRISSVGEGDWVSLERDGKQGFLNLATRQTTGLVFDAFPSEVYGGPLFSRGPEPALKGKKFGYVDEAGRTVIPFQFDLAHEFDEQGMAAVKTGDSWGYVNRRGGFLFPTRFESARAFDTDGLANVQVGGLWGVIDRRGHFVFPAKFQAPILTVFQSPISAINGNIAIVKSDGRMGLVDTRGRTVAPFKFSVIGGFSENGLAPASLDANPEYLGSDAAHWGFIDRSGRFVIPPIYAHASSFQDVRGIPGYPWPSKRAHAGLAEVQSLRASKVTIAFIDRRGRTVIRLPAGLSVAILHKNGLITVMGDGDLAWGLFDPAKPHKPISWFDGIG
ncbi:MAG: WG repeat-containing protein [Caulobacteraceae bacterium]